jgi:hypothetical protein
MKYVRILSIASLTVSVFSTLLFLGGIIFEKNILAIFRISWLLALISIPVLMIISIVCAAVSKSKDVLKYIAAISGIYFLIGLFGFFKAMGTGSLDGFAYVAMMGFFGLLSAITVSLEFLINRSLNRRSGIVDSINP